MKSPSNGRPVEILLVEDNPGDVRFTEEVLKDASVRNHLIIAKDGAEALAFLRREGQFSKSPAPDLILLDLNLPRKNGLETLTEIKNLEGSKEHPVSIP